MALTQKTQTVERIIVDVVARMRLCCGDAFPFLAVCKQAEAACLSPNDVVDTLQGLRDRRLLTATEHFTEGFFQHFQMRKAG